MSLFESVSRLFSRPQPSSTPEEFPIPHGLTHAELQALKRLGTEDGWKVLEKVVDSHIKLTGEKILQTSKEDALHFHRGSVYGMRKIAGVIKEITLREAHFENERDRRVRPERNRSSLFGTAGWRPQSSDNPTG